MTLLLVVALASGAYVVGALVPRHWNEQPPPIAIAGGIFLVSAIGLQVAVRNHDRGTALVMLVIVGLAAAVPLGLAARRTSLTHRTLEERFRQPVIVSLGLFVTAVVLFVVTALLGAIVPASDDTKPEATRTTTTTEAVATTTEPDAGSTTTTEADRTTTTETATTVPGPATISKATTKRDAASGPLHIVLQDFATTKSSVAISVSNGTGLLIIFDAGDLGTLSGQYRIDTSKASVAEADIQIAMTQSQEKDVTILADGVRIATCHPAGTATGTCELG